MDGQKAAREGFRVNIRQRQISGRMEAMRSKLHTPTEIDYSIYAKVIPEIQTGQKTVSQCQKQLKILSFNPQGAQAIFQTQIHHGIYKYLQENNTKISAAEYSDILTIIINLCVHVQLDISNQVMQIIASSILVNQRQMISLWTIANIIYQQSPYSNAIAAELISNCSVLEFMKKRLQQKFTQQGELIVFNFFACSFLTVGNVLTAENARILFGIIETMLKFEKQYEEILWFLSQALVDYGIFIGVNQYEIFQTSIIKKFQKCCKQKKTKFIKNYLKMLLNFVSVDEKAYEKMLKYQLFTSLDFCLLNRFPEVKKICAEIGSKLLQRFEQKIDIENVGFFSQIVLQIVSLQKLPLDCQIQLIQYSNRFFDISIDAKITKQSKQAFIQQILQGSTITMLSTVALNCNNILLIHEIIKLLLRFMKIDQHDKVKTKCITEKLPEFLRSLQTNNAQIDSQIENFLQKFDSMSYRMY